jgi:hypothetical protein
MLGGFLIFLHDRIKRRAFPPPTSSHLPFRTGVNTLVSFSTGC